MANDSWLVKSHCDKHRFCIDVTKKLGFKIFEFPKSLKWVEGGKAHTLNVTWPYIDQNNGEISIC